MVGFKFNNFVRLHGLSSATYNGKLARITSVSPDEYAGRFRVELHVDEEDASHLPRDVILVKPENMARACDRCYHAGAATMQYCGRCRNAAYCNAECQRSDWKRHKVDCGIMNARRQVVKSPLHLAAAKGNLAEVENLVREGADVNKGSKDDGITPLYTAAENGHLAVVQYLIQKGADKDKASNDGSPLYLAACNGHLSVVRYLMQQGADKDKISTTGHTALCMAAQEGHLAVVQYLVQQGADKNKATIDGTTPLCIAATNGHLAVVQYLEHQGADKSKATNTGWTPLFVAARQRTWRWCST